LNGFNSPVSLTLSGLPSGVNGAFSIPSGTPDFSSTLTLTLPLNAPTGSYTLTVTGTGGGLSHVANVILVIGPAPQSQTTSQVTQPSNTQASNQPGVGDIMSLLQSNMLLLGAVIVILLLAAIVAALARRKSNKPATGQTSKTGAVFCKQCGTSNPTANEFCGKCGAKL
jgi:hypothetical protein